MITNIIQTPFRHSVYRDTAAERVALSVSTLMVLDEFYELDTGLHYVWNFIAWEVD